MDLVTFLLHKGIEHNRFCYTNASNICYMKTFQTMDCVFNEIILCNCVWHWCESNAKSPWLFPNAVGKTKILIFSPKSKIEIGPTHNSVARCWVDELRTPRTSDQIWPGIRKVDLGPNYGDSGCLELKAGWFGLATTCPGWPNFSHRQWSVGEENLISEKSFSAFSVDGWKTNLDFSPVFFESHPLRYNFTPYQVFTIWNVFHHPYLHIYPPTQTAVPHIARMVFT